MSGLPSNSFGVAAMDLHLLRGDVAEAQAVAFVRIGGRTCVAAGFLNGFICIWDVETQVLRCRWQAHAIAVTTIVSPADDEFWRCVAEKRDADDSPTPRPMSQPPLTFAIRVLVVLQPWAGWLDLPMGFLCSINRRVDS